MSRLPVVVIDDDDTIREGLRDFLEFEGYEVQSAENGLQGLELIRQLNGRCFVLLDLQMPLMSGETLVDEVQKDRSEEVRKVPIVVLSARAEGLHSERIVGYIRKPVELDDLLNLVVKYCGSAAQG